MHPALLLLAALSSSTGVATSGAARPAPIVRGDPSALSTGGVVWTLNAGSAASYARLGDRGGQVLASPSSGASLLLLSSFDADPPLPAWSVISGGGGNAVAAREADVFLDCAFRIDMSGTAQAVLRKRTSSSDVPDWYFGFQPQAISFASCDVSRDGRTIVSLYYEDATGETQFRVHDPATGVPARAFLLPHPAWTSRFDLSPDGSTAAFSRGTVVDPVTDVVDIEARAVVFSTPGMLPWKQSISDEGRVLAVREKRVDGWHMRVLVRQGGGYRDAVDHASPLDVEPTEMAVSDDGSTVAAAWFENAVPGRFTVRAFDVASGTTTMERSVAVPSLVNAARDIAISADGSRFVVGSTGDGAGLAAEVAVYSPTRSEPLVEYPALGSVYSVDISPDGDRFVVSRALGHVQNGSNQSRIQMIEIGGEDLVVRGRPSIGSTIGFELHATPGATAYLLSSPRLAREPLVLPGIGTLVLAPSFLRAVPIGVVPPTGVLVHPLALAFDPATVGTTSHYQGLTIAPRVLTHDWVQLTVLP